MYNEKTIRPLDAPAAGSLPRVFPGRSLCRKYKPGTNVAVASEKAYELLKQRVIAGTYAPGAQLKEEHIARELEISRTPIRAALKRLVQDGLASADAGRGVRVSEWTEADIEE